MLRAADGGGVNILKRNSVPGRMGETCCCTRLIETSTLGDDAEVQRNRMRGDRGGGEKSHVLSATIHGQQRQM